MVDLIVDFHLANLKQFNINFNNSNIQKLIHHYLCKIFVKY